MSLQWMLIANVLYAEVGLILLLVLPIISARRWSKIFKSRFFEGIKAQIGVYFLIVLGLLVLCFIDAIREMMKYHTQELHDNNRNLGSEMQTNMRMFRAQRNFYISGFTLFLYFVIRRLIILIIKEAELQVHLEASLKQAKSASNAARSLLEQQDDSKSNDEVKNYREKIELLNEKLKNMTTAKDDLAHKYENLVTDFEKVTKDLQKANASVKPDDKKKQ